MGLRFWVYGSGILTVMGFFRGLGVWVYGFGIFRVLGF